MNQYLVIRQNIVVMPSFLEPPISICAIMHFRINFVLDTPSDGLMDKLLISDDNVDQFVHSCAVQL